jgi:hypothetical protein
MPYIITTTTPGPRYSALANPRAYSRSVPDVTRTAVATLEEAREAVERKIRYLHAHAPEDHPDYRPFIPDELPDSGGTVGPLPDGTVIEVRQAPWRVIATEVGAPGDPLTDKAQAQVLAAFNS